jgi:hypothetical protein
MIQNSLIDLINQNLKRGIDPKSIEDELVNSGWKIKDIRDTIKYAQEINQNGSGAASAIFSSRRTWIYASLPIIFVAAGIFIFFILTSPHAQYSANQISNGVNVNLAQGKNTTFAVDNQQHIIEVNSVSTNSAVITIHSNPIILNLTVGETKEVDLNGDGTPDIIVKLVSINNGVPNVYIQKIKANCTENWQCGNWSECRADGKEIRTCTDLNSCGTDKSMPPAEKNCNYNYSATNDHTSITSNFSPDSMRENSSVNFSARLDSSLNKTTNGNAGQSLNQTNSSTNLNVEANIPKGVNLSTPESAAKAVWESFNNNNSKEFYYLSSSELRSKCDESEPFCNKTFYNAKALIIYTRGYNLFVEPNYRMTLSFQNSTDANVLIYAPTNITWPVTISLEKEDSLWWNQKIIIS